MAITFKFYHDAALTSEVSAGNPIQPGRHHTLTVPAGNRSANRRSRLLMAMLTIVGIALFLGVLTLGTWQVQRRTWKLDLMARVEQRVHQAPGAVPADIVHAVGEMPQELARLLRGQLRDDAASQVIAHKRLQAALFEFAGTAPGRRYFNKTLQLDFRPLDAVTLKRMDSFTTVFDAP